MKLTLTSVIYKKEIYYIKIILVYLHKKNLTMDKETKRHCKAFIVSYSNQSPTQSKPKKYNNIAHT